MTGTHRISPGREYAAVLVLLALCAVVLLACLARPWAAATVVDMGSREESVTGSSLFPVAQAGALLALTGIAGLIATRSLGRRMTGVLVLVSGAVALFSGTYFLARGETLATDAISARGNAEWTGLSLTAWWLPASLAGFGVLVTGVVTIVHGHRWPTLGSRYERGLTSGRAEASPWEALDHGVDPTEGPQVPESVDGLGTSGDHSPTP